MSARMRMAFVKGMRSILLLAAWGLVVASVVMLFIGQGDAGGLVLVGAIFAFFAHAFVTYQAMRFDSTGNLLADLSRAESLLGQGEYAAAARVAEAGLQSKGDGALMRPFVLLVSAVSLAASGKHDRARRALSALENVPLQGGTVGDEPGLVFGQIIRSITAHLDAGVPDPEALVADYLRRSDTMFK